MVFLWRGMSCVFQPSHLAPSMSQTGHQAAGPTTWPGLQLPCESQEAEWPCSLTWPLAGGAQAGAHLQDLVWETCFPKVRWALLPSPLLLWMLLLGSTVGNRQGQSVCCCLLCSWLGRRSGLLLASPLSVVTSFGEEVSGKSSGG